MRLPALSRCALAASLAGFGLLPAGGAALAAPADAPMATAQASAPPAPTGAGDDTAAKIRDFVKGDDDDGGALDLGPDATPDRKVHGSVSAWVGNHGQRGFAAEAVGPLGRNGTLAIAVSVGHGPAAWGAYGYGPLAYPALAPSGPLDPAARRCRAAAARDPLAQPPSDCAAPPP